MCKVIPIIIISLLLHNYLGYADMVFTVGGRNYFGNILFENNEFVVLETSISVEVFPKSEIKDIKETDYMDFGKKISKKNNGMLLLKDGNEIVGEILRESGNNVVIRANKNIKIIPIMEIERVTYTFTEIDWLFKVSSILGETTVNNGNVKRKIVYGSELKKGDEITTSSNSSMEMISKDGDIIQIMDNTRLYFEKYEESAGRKDILLKLHYGECVFNIKEVSGEEKSFDIKTENVEVTTRTSDFLLSYDNNEESSNVIVYKGIVKGGVSGKEFFSETYFAAGQKAIISTRKNSNVTDQKRASDEELDKTKLKEKILKFTEKKHAGEKVPVKFTRKRVLKWTWRGLLITGGVIAAIISVVPPAIFK